MKMNDLNIQAQEIQDWFACRKIDLDVFKEHPVGNPDEPHRLYISSKPLGGPLAINNGDGWVPIFPEKPSYPLKGRWYVPSTGHFNGPKNQKWEPSKWEIAVKAALRPELYDFGEVGNKVARDRASRIRNSFRAAVMYAILHEGGEDNGN